MGMNQSVIQTDTAQVNLETLLPYRLFMSFDQLERFGDYLAHRKIEKPFTWEEITQLEKIRKDKLRFSSN
jgi:hypothetical protein